MLNKVIGKSILLEESKFILQKLYENLLKISLNGMNIGTGGNISSDGELKVIHYIRNQCLSNRNTVIFDVGANIGDYSKAVTNEFKNLDFQLNSFEPCKKTFLELKRRLGSLQNIKLHNIGFGERSDVKTLFYDEKKPGLASLYNRRLQHFGVNLNQREPIRIYTIDDFCKRNRIRTIDFLKLDTEGYELNILNGAKGMIKNNSIRFIQFEFGGCNIDSKTYFQDFFYLLNKKYNIYRILKEGLYKINAYKEIYEIFLTTNYIAELK